MSLPIESEERRGTLMNKGKSPKFPKKDFLAFLIAFYQLFVPLLLALLIAGIIVALIIRHLF